MSYNTLKPFKIDCPACGVRSEHQVQFQTASSYQGDSTGRFCLRLYAFGDKLAWWPRSDERYPKWREGTRHGNQKRDSAEEELAVKCPDCRSDLCVVIGFESLYIVGVVNVIRANTAPQKRDV